MDRKTHKRPAYYVTTYNGTSDLAGQLVAAFASSSLAFRGVDDRYSDKLMTAALRLYGAATRHSGRYTKPFVYKCAPDDPNAQLRAPNKPQCKPADVVFKGSAVGLYNSTSYRDDLTWAAAWMNRATGDRAYLDDAYKYFVQHANEEGQADQRLLVDWDHVAWPATVLLASLTDDAAFHKPAQDFLARWLCTSSVVSYTDLGRAYNHFDPRVGTTMNVAMLSAVYGAKRRGRGFFFSPRFLEGETREREREKEKKSKKLTFFFFFSTFASKQNSRSQNRQPHHPQRHPQGLGAPEVPPRPQGPALHLLDAQADAVRARRPLAVARRRRRQAAADAPGRPRRVVPRRPPGQLHVAQRSVHAEAQPERAPRRAGLQPAVVGLLRGLAHVQRHGGRHRPERGAHGRGGGAQPGDRDVRPVPAGVRAAVARQGDLRRDHPELEREGEERESERVEVEREREEREERREGERTNLRFFGFFLEGEERASGATVQGKRKKGFALSFFRFLLRPRLLFFFPF